MGKGTKQTAKIKKMELVDGKADRADSESRTFANIRTIDEILGEKPQGAFKANSLEEFEKQIDVEMNLADMQTLASRVGLLPIHDRQVLKKRLLDEFKKDLRKKTGYGHIDAVRPSANLNMEQNDRARRILKEGR